MAQIPLDAFRILNKKFGWEKSFTEIVNDDLDDVTLFKTSLEISKERFLTSDSDELGDWENSSLDIAKIWLQYFILEMRFNVKRSYLLRGIETRGLPKKLVDEHLVQMDDFREKLESLFLSSTYVHIIFFFQHLFYQESKRGRQAFFELIFEDQYLNCLSASHEMALKHPMFSTKTVDLRSLERKLRIQWMGDFKILWAADTLEKKDE